MDLSSFTVDNLKNLQSGISGELAKRAGECIDLRYNDTPRSGAVFYDRPAIGGDRNEDLWFPTLEAANAHLVRMAGEHSIKFREDGTAFCDYSAPGCQQSDMETRLVELPQVPSEPVASRTCSYCGVVTPRDNAQCYLCGLEVPRTRRIEFASGCLYQPNAVELSTGVIVFDACGECEQCGKHGLSKGSACKDGAVIRKATDHEAAQQTIVINASEEPRGAEPTSTPQVRR